MQKSSDMPRWWDWFSISMLFFMLETVASRLVSTNWISFLFLTQTVTYIGYVIGTILGYTRFSPGRSRLISSLYLLIMLPLQWTLVIDQNTSLEEQLLSVGGRLYYSFSDFFMRRDVEDPIFMIVILTVLFWVVSTSAGFRMVRKQNYLAAVVPSAVSLLVIQSYDNAIAGRVWYIAFFAFMALLLLGRLHHLDSRQSWRERRIFLSPDNNADLSSIMAIAAAVIVLFAWTPPASAAGVDSAIQTWNKITKPWREFTDRIENAVAAFDSPSGGKRGEFFGSELALGRGFPLSDLIMFRVETPDLPTDQKPPRYYWRGRTYDYFTKGRWFTTGSTVEDYSPGENVPVFVPAEAPSPARFVFNAGETTFSLIYAPSQTVWLSRPGSTRILPAGELKEVVSWYAYPALLAGEVYQVDTVINNPNIEQLREAGTDYPEWIEEKYLQVPEEFSSRIIELAGQIAAEYDNPYDKTVAVTTYLRNNIVYADTIPQAPRNRDPLEWMLFENKQAYCVYYASAETLMLRSLGIPARMAVGFAQGERTDNEYIVRRNNAHAWPEVYFPGIGWVEFEPTGSQPELTRPLPPSDEENDGADANLPDLANRDSIREDLRGLQEEGDVAVPDQADAAQMDSLNRYLVLIFIILAALTVYFGRRYSIPARLPTILRTTFERSGLQTPSWIIHWERWMNISPIERSFESINFGLRLLDRPMPIDATPIERAKGLKRLLPRMENEINALLDEHQTSLYTSREANVFRAGRAAFNIRLQAMAERIRYIFEGKPIENP